jgi:N-acetylglucosamine-6-phosphate deacetylase
MLLRQGRIAAIDPRELPDSCPRIDGGGRLMTPGLIDLHIHGMEHFLFERSVDELLRGVERLAAYGVTTVLPTLYRCLGPEGVARVGELASALGRCESVRVPGFHLEGPFLKLAGAGGLTLDGDVPHLDALLEAADGKVSAMSISPDTVGIIPVIERLRGAGIKAFMTHTQAGVDDTVAAIRAGATHATHFYDVFYPPPEREPGARPVGCVETVLAESGVTVDFIADGVHVDPMAIRMALAVKGVEGVTLITDANLGAGLPPQVLDPGWGFDLRIDDRTARIEAPGTAKHGGLAGSTLTLPRAVANAMRWLDRSDAEVWSMASRSPARAMGWSGRGQLRPGFDADLVLWDGDAETGFQAWRTFVAGRCVYKA